MEIIGHGNYRYKVDADWGKLDPALVPVKDCHEMVLSKSGLLYLLTNEVQNNIIVYTKEGKLVKTWGTTYPGAHGLTIAEENGAEFLYITDTIRHEVIKTNLDGEEIMVIGYPKEITDYTSAELYKPTETAIGPNGDIYVTDGYGLQVVIQYNADGKYIRHWGGKGNGNGEFDCVHGIAIDDRNPDQITLLITSRNHSMIKRFSLTGAYLNSILLSGSFVCRPVIKDKNIYAAVFRSGNNMNFGSGYITILDENDQVISTPGGTSPIYKYGLLQTQQQATTPTFIHPHDVCIDEKGDIYVPQWNANKTYPIKLHKIA
jgi:peptidylamidoglycolate lyase